MKNIFIAFIALVSATTFAAAKFKSIHIADFESLRKQAPTVAVFDANVESTRNKIGLIPGAHALSSFDKYAASELPPSKDTPLVFYCANTMCTASHRAAERATALGYKKVFVMVDGIYGWKSAGKPLDPYKSASQKAVEISPQDAKKMVDSKSALILDVREGEERHEVIPKAEWLPMSKMDSPEWTKFVKGLDKSKTVVIHCASGIRAKKVAEKLALEGYRTAYFKGPDQWKESGLAVEAGPAQ